MQLVECVAESLGLLEFGDRISEVGCARYCVRNGAGAADGVNQIVVVQHRAGRQLDRARGGVDPLGVVDQQSDPFAQQGSVVDGRIAAAGDQLMKADSLDEHRARVDHGDVDRFGVESQMVGGQCAGVSAADHDDVSALDGHGCLLFGWDVLPSRHRGGRRCDSDRFIVIRLTAWRTPG